MSFRFIHSTSWHRLVFTVVSGALCALAVVPEAHARSEVEEYFWPAHREGLDYRVRSYALRGRLVLAHEGEVRIADQTWQVVRVSSKQVPSLDETVYMRADEHGIYTRYSKELDAKEVRDLMFPLTIGKAWATVNRDGSLTRRTIESIEECKIRDLVFERCVRVSFDSASGQAVAFFAPGYGEIVNSQSNGFNERTIAAK